MGALWNVTVIGQGKDWVDLKVVVIHPDAGSFPAEPTFALQLLTNPAYRFVNLVKKATSPLGKEFEPDLSYMPYDLEKHQDRYVSEIAIYEVKNYPFKEDVFRHKIEKKVLALGIKKEDSEWEKTYDKVRKDFWEDPNAVPSAKYRIWVTDPKWIKHLKVKMTFRSSAYSEKGPWVSKNKKASLPKRKKK